jgi:hypothetical protein
MTLELRWKNRNVREAKVDVSKNGDKGLLMGDILFGPNVMNWPS